MKSLKNFVAVHAASVRFWVGMLGAYVGFKMSSVPAFAATGTGFNIDNWTSGDDAASGSLANIFMGMLVPLQDFSTVLMILFAVICGLKLGGSAVVGDSRSRTGAIVGLFFIILGEVIVIHARAVVAFAQGAQPTK